MNEPHRNASCLSKLDWLAWRVEQRTGRTFVITRKRLIRYDINGMFWDGLTYRQAWNTLMLLSVEMEAVRKGWVKS